MPQKKRKRFFGNQKRRKFVKENRRPVEDGDFVNYSFNYIERFLRFFLSLASSAYSSFGRVSPNLVR